MIDWIKEVFSHPSLIGALIIFGKTSLIYFFLVAGLRLMGKRELGQMTVYDLVLIIVLADAVQNAMVGNDSTLVGGIVAATTLLIWNRIFTLILGRSDKIERLMVGEPRLLVNDGQLNEAILHKEGISREQLMAALREHGLDRIEDAHMCVLEVDGTISVVPQTSTVHRSRRHYKALRLP